MGIYFETGMPWTELLRPERAGWLQDLGVRGHPLLLSRGRDCLYVITRLLGLQPGDELLLPALVCAEVLNALESWGFQVTLYDIGRDLVVDTDGVHRHISPSTRAIVYLNYFGLGQPAATVAKLLQHGLPLIEDSCQSPFPVSRAGSGPDFAFTSLRKYVSVPDGAVLDVISPRWADEAARVGRRLPVNAPLAWRRTLALSARGLQERRDQRTLGLLADELFSGAQRALRAVGIPRRIHPLSAHIAARLDVPRLRECRRDRFRELCASLSGLGALAPVRAEPPDDGCPYGLPVLVPDNRILRDALACHGIQSALLWEPARPGDAWPQAAWLSRHILVLPISRPGTTTQVASAIRAYQAISEGPTDER